MNQTIPTTTRRRSLRHAALALCALVALVAASCTADALDGPDPGAPSGNNPDDVLTFAVAPRPGFTEVTTTRATDTKAVIPGLTRDLPNRSAALIEQEIAGQARNDRESARNDRGSAPATRAELADDATRWEQGDILWLQVFFSYDKQNIVAADTAYISALKYDANEWRYLTQAEAEDLNTGNIPRFSRLVRWPRESKDWVDPGISIVAYYAGSGKPDADGTITIIPHGEIPTMPLIIGGTDGTCSPGEKLVLSGFIGFSRLRIPAGYAVELPNTFYFSAIEFSSKGIISREFKLIDPIPAQSEDTDVFLMLKPGATAKLTRDGVSCTFTFPTITDEYGNPTCDNVSYTLTPYTSGTETPVADYDLTIADEAGLRAFAQAVNAGDRLPNGKPAAEAKVLQTADIHLTQGEWVPIGYSRPNRFRGAYNGNGNEITGLTITMVPQPSADQGGVPASCAGLFGYAEGAVLTGIRLRGVGINITDGGDVILCVGSIAGIIENSTLSLCTADGTVNADGGDTEVDAGGVAGYSIYSTISRCRADVETKAAAMWAYAGGIAGWNGVCNFILSCESGDRAVTAEGPTYAYAGGIAGFSSNNSFIAFCRTGKNNVTAQNGNGRNYAGGLVGENNGNLVSCYSRATAQATGTGRNRAGAIAGYSPGGEGYCYGVGATDRGTSDLAADPNLNIFYNADPKDGDIFRVMTGFTGKVESIIDGGKTYYPFTTTYTPSATPAYGIIPQRAVWTKDAWKDGGSDPRFPEIDYDYEGK